MPGCRRIALLILISLVPPALAWHPPERAAAAPGAAGTTVRDAYVPAPPARDLLPAPKEVRWGVRSFAVRSSTRIILADGTDVDLFPARELAEELRTLGAPTLQEVRAGSVADPTGHIVIGEAGANPHVRRLLEGSGAKPVANAEGYLLQVTPSYILVAGADRRGTFYGVQTLRQLLRPTGGRSLPAVVIRDWPDHPIRAVHILADRASDPFHIQLIDRILAPYKINTLLVEAQYVQWESGRPFWSPDPRGATKAQISRLLAAARDHYIQVIPLVATLGHSEWVTGGLRDQSLCQQVAYIPRRLREEGRAQVTCDRSRGIFPPVYDPENRISVDGTMMTLQDALIIPVLGEAIELFRPAYLHLGHDEVRGPSGLRYDMDLYLRDIIVLGQVLTDAGVRPMIWGDVLWERRAEAEADPQFAALPREMAVVAWKYEDVRDYPEVRYFKDRGFDVLGATWYRLQNNYFFSRAAEVGGALGMVRTTWTGQFQNAASLQRAFRQLYTYLSAAAYFWTADRPRPEAFPSEPALARRFAAGWRASAAQSGPIPGRLLDLSDLLTQRHIDDDGRGWLGKGPDYDLRALRPGRQRLGGVLFDILDPKAHGGKSVVMLRGERDTSAALPGRATLRWGGKAACLAFLHTTLDRSPGFGDAVGRYSIHLAGGRVIDADLAYGRDISSWLWDAERGIASIDQEVGWTGSTRAGNEVFLQLLWWRNPDPGRAIERIELSSAGGRASPVVFAITALDRCP